VSLPVNLRTKTYILMVLVVVLGAAGNVLLSRGMKQLGEVRVTSAMELVGLFIGIFTSSWIWMGIITLLLHLACFMLVLSWADYSYASPATAAIYVVVTLVGHLVLGEKVTLLHWIGVLIICMGVGLVGHTAPSTTGEE